MKKIYSLFLLAFAITQAGAQTVSTFENITLSANTYRDGTDSTFRLNGGFTSGKAFFTSDYDTSFGGMWSGGFAVSNKTDFSLDSATLDYTKLFHSVTGGGATNSTNYAVGQQFSVVRLTDSTEKEISGVYVTNSNYAYLAMKWGDGFARQFGDSDFFRLHIFGYHNGMIIDSNGVRVDLAIGKNINTTWQWVDLGMLGVTDSLVFVLTSSDVGQFGINTPAFFCIDGLTTRMPTGIADATRIAEVAIYPNPASQKLYINTNSDVQSVVIFSATGVQVFSGNNNVADISALDNGIYFVRIETSLGSKTVRLIKE